jgi:hypothetical protein
MADSEFIRTVEINGVKLEIDLRSARVATVDTLKVGSKVKLLEPATDYASAKIHSGVVTGFAAFTDMPTIEVAYLEEKYGGSDLKFMAINAAPGKKLPWSIVAAHDDDFGLSKDQILRNFAAEIQKKQNELDDCVAKRDFFLRKFDSYFVAPEAVPHA